MKYISPVGKRLAYLYLLFPMAEIFFRGFVKYTNIRYLISVENVANSQKLLTYLLVTESHGC